MTMMNPEPTYTIQQTSQITGLPSSTLRYYEDIGLLDPIRRTANGHRCYTDQDLLRLDLIKKLRLTGMPLEAMVAFIDLYRAGDETISHRREIMQAHREVVQAHIAELNETLAFIDRKIATYCKKEAEYEREYIEQHDEIPAAG